MTICMAAGKAAGEERDIESGLASSWASSRRQVPLRLRDELLDGLDPKFGLLDGLDPKFGLLDGLDPKFGLLDGLDAKFGALVGLADPLLAFFGTIFAAS
jgi:hypothetical protein